MAWLCSIGWVTDVHVGRADTYTGDNVVPYITPINNTAVRAVVISGDCTEHSTEAEHIAFAADVLGNIDVPVYCVPGNHDRGAGLDSSGFTDDGPDDYSLFTQYIGPTHWSAALPGVTLIGVEVRVATPAGYDNVTPAELAWFEAQLQAAAGRPVLVFVHYPFIQITEDFVNWTVTGTGAAEFRALCAQYGVLAVLSGHRHWFFCSAAQGGATYVNGHTRAWSYNSTPTGYQLIDVFDDRIVVMPYSTPTTQLAALDLTP